MRLNDSTLLNCAFAINAQDEVIVTSSRSTEDLSPLELEEMALHVAQFGLPTDSTTSCPRHSG